MKNRTSLKVLFILLGLSATFMALGEKFGHRHGLLTGFLLALMLNAFVFFYGDLRLLKRFPTELLEGQDPWGLISRLHDFSSKAGIPVPRLFLFAATTPLALSLGIIRSQNAVLLSTALVRELSAADIDAVLAFEVARLKRRDTLASTVAAALTGTFALLTRRLDQLIRLVTLQFIWRRKSPFPGPFTLLFSPLFALMARAAISKQDYLDADALAASWLPHPQQLAVALWKLDSFQNTRPYAVAPSDLPLFMVNPLTSHNWYRYFQVQPSAERRIRLLIGHYPV